MEALSKNRSVGIGISKDKRCLGVAATAKQKRTAKPVTPHFLSEVFEPVICDPVLIEHWQEKQRHFLKSLSHLRRSFAIPDFKMPDLPFPLNIRQAFIALKEHITDQNGYQLFLIRNGDNPYCLASGTTMDTGYKLYYIPLRNLMLLCRDTNRKAESELLLSVCAYLYQKANIPSYIKGDYMDGCYQTLKEWLFNEPQEWDKELLAQAGSEFKAAEYFEAKMHKVLSHPYHLDQWEARMKTVKQNATISKQVYELSERMFALYRKFPERKFHEQFYSAYRADNYDDYEMMPADEYISFVWSNDGWLGEQVFNYINDDSGNYFLIDEPLQLKIFDTPKGRLADNLEYERELFSELTELIYILNELDHD